MQQTLGNRILGGAGSSGGGISTAYGQGVNTALDQQTNRLAQQATRQNMQLNANRDRRAQTELEMRQAAAARAAAAAAQAQRERAQLRAAMQEFAAGVQAPAAGTPAPALREVQPTQAGMQLPAMSTPLVIPGLGGPFGQPQTQPVPTAPGPRVDMGKTGRAEQAVAPNYAVRSDYGQQAGVTPTVAPAGQGGARRAARTGVGRTEPLSLAEVFNAPDAAAANAERYQRRGGLRAPSDEPAPEPAPKEIARTGKDPYIVKQTTSGGETLEDLTPEAEADPVTATQAIAQAAPKDDPTDYFINTPNVTLALSESLATQRRNLELRLKFAADTGNLQLFTEVQDALNSPERVVQEAMMQGQLALIGAQNGNFAALQELMQTSNPNSDVRIKPYTDGTMDIIVDGQVETRNTSDILRGLAANYNDSYKAMLAQRASVAAEREQFAFEENLKSLLRIEESAAAAAATAEAELEKQFGEVKYIGQGDNHLFTMFDSVSGKQIAFKLVAPGETNENGKPSVGYSIMQVPLPGMGY